MNDLKKHLDTLVEELDRSTKDELLCKLQKLNSVYPFNEYEFFISSLIGLNKISLDEYYKLRDEYINRNKYLDIFEINAPRGFGETWAQGHIKNLVPLLQKPTKKLDKDYSGQYDFHLNDIKIEVKASRAVDADCKKSLCEKALYSSSKANFNMNFQQIKPSCCDVFVWVAVWRDVIRYWVLASSEVKSSKYYSAGQHRGNTGEGQLHLTNKNISEFIQFEKNPDELLKAIGEANDRNIK